MAKSKITQKASLAHEGGGPLQRWRLSLPQIPQPPSRGFCAILHDVVLVLACHPLRSTRRGLYCLVFVFFSPNFYRLH